LPLSVPIIKEIKALSTGIPMVGPTPDPVAFGLSTNLARPDGDFTGLSLMQDWKSGPSAFNCSWKPREN
jgi:hypothetical protein